VRPELEMQSLNNHLLHKGLIDFDQVFRVEITGLSSSPLDYGLKAKNNDNTSKQASSYVRISKAAILADR